ncbi:F-box protein [Trifolium pratense]|uniref:F-box protein n=1 Tax=Trifolium pratense TaxID=57577 RepID=A0A2K3LP10_TRIPR|nr:F-box protein [Trifolium pratense]
MLCTMTPRPSEHWPFLWGDGKGVRIPIPQTPKAPRQGPRPPSRLRVSEMRQVTAVLFKESAFPSRCLVPSVISKPQCKSVASNRVLFCEDELLNARIVSMRFCSLCWGSLAGVDIPDVQIGVEG